MCFSNRWLRSTLKPILLSLLPLMFLLDGFELCKSYSFTIICHFIFIYFYFIIICNLCFHLVSDICCFIIHPEIWLILLFLKKKERDLFSTLIDISLRGFNSNWVVRAKRRSSSKLLVLSYSILFLSTLELLAFLSRIY